MHGSSVVVGIGESKYYKRGASPDPEFVLACQAIRRAAEDAGIDVRDIDGIISYADQRNPPVRLAAALGLRKLNFTADPFSGGGNNVAATIQLADAAISAGYAKNVVAFRAIAQGQFGRFGQSREGAARADAAMAWSGVYGLLSPAMECAIHTRRFMEDHGISQEALCDIVLACYSNAQRNPRALRNGTDLTREEYHDSRWITEPFHLYDCCPENDGAAAAVLTSSERARDLRAKPVSIVAAAQCLGPRFGVSALQPRWLGGSFYSDAGETLWQHAGMRPSNIDVVQFYENFSGMVMITLCEMGFCQPDEVEAFVANGALEGPDARTPFNTSGGNIAEAYIHGFELINEAVRQVRGESTCQVADVETSLVVGGPGYAPASTVLFGPAR
ncbi:MAG: acetyl-CoA acetyltransferase [Deltaproteobacteria bacterium]|nr:acetyl-CoA acetyltransferase [Deltaproteobacteria bacterium]